MPSKESSLPPRSPGDNLAAGSTATGSFGPQRSGGLPIVVITAWAGATMLAGQIAWIRLAAAQVGCNLSAVVVLLTAAMIGLSVGSRIVARRIERIAIGRRLIVQQFLAAIFLLVSPAAITWAGNLAAAVARSRGWQYESSEILAVAAIAVVILLFNVPFGMLLPMAVEIDAKHRFRGLSRQVGLLGAVQLGGAAVGGVALGLVAPMWIGFDGVLLLAGCVQVVLAIWVIVALARRPELLRPPVPADGESPPLSEPRTIRRLAILLGLLSLAAMLVWLRALSFYLGTTIFTFVLTASTLVGGLAVGGVIPAAVAPRQRRPGQFLAAVLLIAAVLLALAGFWADMAPALLPWVLPSHPAGAFAEFIGRLAVIVVMIGPPAVLIGSTLPLLLRLAAPEGSAAGWPVGRAGRIVARVLASYTLGGALGAVVAFSGFLQMMDGRSALLAVAVGHMVAALWAEVLDPATGWHRSTARASQPQPDDQPSRPDTHAHTRRRRLHAATHKRIPWPNLALFAAATAVCIWQAGQGSMFRKAYLGSAAGPDAISEDDLPKAMLEGSTRPLSVGLAIDESRGGVVATRRNCATGRLELLVGQDVIADDSPQSIYVQRTQGLLPLLLAPADHPRRALVIGLGSGASVAPLVQAGVERITVAEPFEAVTECALGDITRPNFAQANDNLRDHRTVEFSPDAPPAAGAGSPAESSATTKPMTAPAVLAAPTTRPDAGVQVQVIGSDGRSVLRFEPSGWQIILVNPTDPSAFGAGTLFSKEFYRLAYDRLADDGIFVQWLPLGSMGDEAFDTVVNAFLTGFETSNANGRTTRAGFVVLEGMDTANGARPMLAIIGGRAALNLSEDGLLGRIAQLRPRVDRVTSRNRPSMKELGLSRTEDCWGGLIQSGALYGLARCQFEPIACDELPRTEMAVSTMNPFHGSCERLKYRLESCVVSFNEVTSLPELPKDTLNQGLKTEESPGPHPAVARGPGYRMTERERLVMGPLPGICGARELLSQAIIRVCKGERGPEIRSYLAAATQRDSENSFARLSLDHMDCDAELARVRVAWKDKKLTVPKAVAELSRIAERFPLDVTCLWMKFAVQRESKAKEAMNTLEEILGRAPNSPAAHFWKARLLSDQVAGDLAAGRFADAAKKAKLANEEKANGRALRSGEIPADSVLGETIRSQIAAAAKGNAASQPAGK